MASSVVTELETGLQGMLSLKPPGVSGSRITNITALCVANVQYESVLIQKLFTHFKKTPGTHKLGVLYVVDSVTRKWLDQAKAQGQTPSLSAPDGTFAAGVHRVTELIPILMNDILATAPEDQKVRREHCIAFPGTYPARLVPGTTHGDGGSQGHARGIPLWNCSSLSVSRSCLDLRTRTLFSRFYRG